ncbi:MAG: hypothetical protein ISR76_05960 [Planctomycetes bacterium]|nr:hypothetical protein [Planctomycetota bacterium]MBL7008524.1 hypothetical protein [Planctomycetota bacterium]
MNPRTPIFCLLAAAALLPGTAAGQQVPLDQPPSQVFSLWSHSGVQANADNFVLPSTTGAILDQVTWWGGWDDDQLHGDTFDISVHLDAPGPLGSVPGAAIASYLGVSPAITATGVSFPAGPVSLDEYRFQYRLPVSLPLAGGTYWVQIICTGSSGAGTSFNWEMAPQDFAGGLSCMAWSLDTPGVTWWPCTPLPETDLALRLEELGASGPALSVNNLAAGAVAVISVDNATPNGVVRHGYSLAGGGPKSTPFGDLLLTPPYTELPQMTADGVGHASIRVPVPAGASGVAVWLHAFDLGSVTFTNGLAEVVG